MKHSSYQTRAAVNLFAPPSDQPDIEPSKALLDYLPVARRSMVMNLFLRSVRDGADSIETALAAVLRDLAGRLRMAGNCHDKIEIAKLQEIGDTIAAYPHEAHQLAAHALTWEGKPRAVREAMKAQAAQAHRTAWMQSQPAMPRQLAYLRYLGYTGPVENKAHAHRPIDALVQGRAT